MLEVGINGFGRIGKTIFLQLINHPYIIVSKQSPFRKLLGLECY